MIYLINPNLVIQRSDFMGSGIPYMPHMLAYTVGWLKNHGIEVRVIDSFGDNPFKITAKGGFSPDKFISLINAIGNFPNEASIKQLKDMDVAYIVIHKVLFKSQDEYQSLLFKINDFEDEIQKTKDFANGDVVLRMQ